MESWIHTHVGCYTCKFWRGDRNLHGSQAYGACRRNPPVAIEKSRGIKYSTFPDTHGTEWCGEYVDKAFVDGN